MVWVLTPTDITVRYHRNGIGGRGFTAITFTSTDKDEPYYDGRLTAIIPEPDEYEFHDVECYVTHTSKPELCYRGDNFYSVMREIITAHDIKYHSQIIEHQKNPPSEYVELGITKFKNMDEVRETIAPKPIPEVKVVIDSGRFSGIE